MDYRKLFGYVLYFYDTCNTYHLDVYICLSRNENKKIVLISYCCEYKLFVLTNLLEARVCNYSHRRKKYWKIHKIGKIILFRELKSQPL